MTTPQQQPAPSADDFLMGGSGAPSAKFLAVGTIVTGQVTTRPSVEQQRDIKDGSPKFWNDGNPMMQLVVTVQTNERDPQLEEDDGKRRIFVKGQMKNAVADAVRASGARGLEVGGVLTITYTHDGVATQRGFNPPKQYAAQYVAAETANVLDLQQPPAAPAVAGLTPQQQQAAAQNPATAALLAQQQATTASNVPPF